METSRQHWPSVHSVPPPPPMRRGRGRHQKDRKGAVAYQHHMSNMKKKGYREEVKPLTPRSINKRKITKDTTGRQQRGGIT